MRTAVDVGEVAAFEVDDQRVKIALAAAQGKLFALSMFNLAHDPEQFSR
jgi:hypothetical protein